jgi:hypothetical protein
VTLNQPSQLPLNSCVHETEPVTPHAALRVLSHAEATADYLDDPHVVAIRNVDAVDGASAIVVVGTACAVRDTCSTRSTACALIPQHCLARAHPTRK